MNKKKNIVAKGYIFLPTKNIISEGFEAKYENYIFSQREIEMLCEGQEVIAESMEAKAVLVRLEEVYEDSKMVYKVLKAIPRKTLSHVWSKEEKQKLYKGDMVFVDDLYEPKTCRYFKGYCKWNEQLREIKVYMSY